MSHLKNYSYEKQGVWNRDNYHYVQAVRIENRIELAGQGGWDHETGIIKKDMGEQIDQAFANVERALLDAGGKGWSQVFRVNTYHIPLSDEVQDHMVRNFRKYMPIPHATWTCVEVTRLGGGPDMLVEIEVSAHDPEGAAKVAAESA
ncbi:related to L-PSP endoribonuclease family protein [Cephalotrichum gorgonifer]|uniref:Related to L-PSP endoribonuclease family protein n=1 Tax=Cephalotrichum gorgonifer TaxID=2041049 RepID=A0AAE8N8T2_9PEZI|nr:related to L-PSP endoribonuclease family protein [Cephalotrichum gorgonifer]